MVKGDVKDLNWNRIIRCLYPVSSLDEALLCFIRDRILKQTIMVRTRDKPWFDKWCILAFVRSREHIECGVVIVRRLIGKSIE